MKMKFRKLYPDAITPTRAKPGDSGLDLYAYLPYGPAWLSSGDRGLFMTGITIELPEGYEAQVRGRSGLTKLGIVACGGLGTVDNGYRGDIGVTLFNLSFVGHKVSHGDRIAQLVVAPVAYPELEEVTELGSTERGASGFGSTGV